MYEDNRISQYFASQTLNDIYYPGGAGGTMANDLLCRPRKLPIHRGDDHFQTPLLVARAPKMRTAPLHGLLLLLR